MSRGCLSSVIVEFLGRESIGVQRCIFRANIMNLIVG